MQLKNPIKSIQSSDLRSRKLLARLITFIYQDAKANGDSLTTQAFSFNTKQADKYRQYQFSFDPKNGFEHYKDALITFIQKIKPNSEEKEELARDLFDGLKAEHPLGVELWVYPKDASYHPLVENNAQLAIDSVLSAAKMMLNDSLQYQLELGMQEKSQINEKHATTLDAIEAKYKETMDAINALYELEADAPYLKKWGFHFLGDTIYKDKSPEFQQYKDALAKVKDFQRFVVANLAAFKKLTDQLPSNKDYKQAYKDLARYEQQLKLRGFYRDPQDKKQNDPKREVKDDLTGDVFNRDIFTIDINTIDDSGDITGNWHYYDRHSTLTSAQIEWKKSEESNQARVTIDPYVLQATATSHSPDYLLANSAIVEEGTFDKDGLSIDFITARHGSPAPNELYPKGNLPRKFRKEKHEATLRAFLNMDQHLQKIRTKVIEAILKKFNIYPPYSPTQIVQLSNQLSVRLSAVIEEANLTGREVGENDLKSAIYEAEAAVFGALDNFLDPRSDNFYKEFIKHIDEVINVKNLHTHLITATGFGSTSQAQRYHFYDSRIAQYATWGRDNKSGYVYMSNGINFSRFDTLMFDIGQQLPGTNAVAFIELYKHIAATDNYDPARTATSFQLDQGQQKKEVVQAYDRALDEVKARSKAYIQYLKTTFRPLNTEIDKLTRAISEDQLILKQLNPDSSDVEYIKYYQAKARYNQNVDLLKTKKKELKTKTKEAQRLRDAFTKAESVLHKKATVLNKNLYKELKEKESEIESLNDDPTTRNKYLSQKAFFLAQHLFHETSRGLAKWKSDDFNGIMQALINLASEQGGVFASSGCKSANDREFILALIITKLSAYISTQDRPPLNLDILKNILQESQKAFAWHISRRQTGLDRSAIPKTDLGLLKFAQKELESFAKQEGTVGYSHIGSHREYETMAADKRKEVKDIDQAHMRRLSYRQDEPDLIMITTWEKSPLRTKYKDLTTLLESYQIQKGMSNEVKKEKLMAIQKIAKNHLRYEETGKWVDIQALCWKLEQRIYVLSSMIEQENNAQAAEETPQYVQLKAFIQGLSDKLTEDNIGRGAGIEKMREILAQFNQNPSPNLNELCQCYFDLRKVAEIRYDDWTTTFAKWVPTKVTNFFNEKRPQWLRDVYKILQKDLNNNDKLNYFSAPRQAEQQGEQPDPTQRQ